ncbi:hypothetical protein [Deferribacter abyssi]|uniref:hypothetical protein n=1 Tax=Deferribacter abyssi TaxID=213806 RepID=UPI003C13B9B6
MKLLKKLSEIIEKIEISHAWFTTFSFSPAFFEKYVLASLFNIEPSELRRLEDYEAINEQLKTVNVKVFYDPVGLNVTESKKTTCDYIPVYFGLRNLEKMEGLFHPKVCFLFGTNKEKKKTTAYLITGSANLTHQAWGRNKETVFVDEIDKKNGERIHNFFTEFFPDTQMLLPKGWYNSLRKDNSNWIFRYIFKNSDNFDGNNILFKDFVEEKELYVWSPYIDADMINLKKEINISGKITLIPGFKNAKIILSKEEYNELSKYFHFMKDERNDIETFVHGKLWLSETKLCIGSWNFTKAAVCGDNFEAGVIIEGNFARFKDGLKELKIEDNHFMTENELKEEQLPKPNKIKFECTVIADWLKRQYEIKINTNKTLKINLPDSEIEINGERDKIVPFINIKKLGIKKIYEVFENEKKVFTGYIQEINTDYRPVYGYSSLNELLNNFSFDKDSNKRQGERYLYGEHNEESGDHYQLKTDNDYINYYSLFYLTESMIIKIEEIETIDRKEELEKKLSEIAYSGANSVEQLVTLAENWIENNIDNKLVMCWFLQNETNKIVRKINNIIKDKKLDLRELDYVKLNESINDKFEKINKINQKWIDYVRA